MYMCLSTRWGATVSLPKVRWWRQNGEAHEPRRARARTRRRGRPFWGEAQPRHQTSRCVKRRRCVEMAARATSQPRSRDRVCVLCIRGGMAQRVRSVLCAM